MGNMTIARIIRCILVAGVLAVICVWTSVTGAAASLIVMAFALYLLPRDAVQADFAEFAPWLLCMLAFALFSVALIPMTELPATNLGLVLFCPVFGIAVFVFERLLASMTNVRRRRK